MTRSLLCPEAFLSPLEIDAVVTRALAAAAASLIRRMDRLRRRPSMSEDANLVLQIRYVVKYNFVTWMK